MNKRRIVILGAGLGGCCLADSLAEDFEVVVVDLARKSNFLQKKIIDLGYPAVISPHIGCGLGGTTKFWHNGLMEIDVSVFKRFWPFAKVEIDSFYERAFFKLSGLSYEKYLKSVSTLRDLLEACGINRILLGNSLFYPRVRLNAWKKFNLSKRVKFHLVDDFDFDFTGDKLTQISFLDNSKRICINSDEVILCAGGIGTPRLLQKIAELKKSSLNDSGLKNSGDFYEDHPTGFVGEVTLNNKLYNLWNFRAGRFGAIRIPFYIKHEGLLISFQLRPAGPLNSSSNIKSILSDLRNSPYNLKNYFSLFRNLDDIFEILSFKFGIKVPTNKYAVLMVAEQPLESNSSISYDIQSRMTYRKWILDKNYFDLLENAIKEFILELGSNVLSSKIYPSWASNITSSAHHSGTARMSNSPEAGVCDLNCKIYGLDNVYICDGSLIPGSGYANTGLTIAALAIRLAQYFRGLHK